jgi:MoaA/NifB/PqqE/SkfB family radical SAM enzyme
MCFMLQQASLMKALAFNRARGLPSKLNLNITSLCNSQCRTCSVWTAYRKNPEKAQDELTADEIKRLLGQPDLPICWLAITGGEPFLRKDLGQILSYVINNCTSIKLLTIPSNGLDKNRIVSCIEKIKDQARLLIYISFSLDGPPGVHDAIRGIKDGYAKTWDTYNEVRTLVAGNKNFHVGFETTLSKHNVADLNDFVRNLISEQHSIVFTIAHNARFYKNQKEEAGLPSRYSAAVKVLVDDINKRTRGLSPDKIFRRVYLKNCAQYIEDPAKRILPCRALQTSLSVDPYGNVFPCLMWDHTIGNVRALDYDLMTLWNSAARLKGREQITKGHCPNCWTPCEAYPSIIENFYRLPVLRNIW